MPMSANTSMQYAAVGISSVPLVVTASVSSAWSAIAVSSTGSNSNRRRDGKKRVNVDQHAAATGAHVLEKAV